jgi:hypothetical protein
MQGSSYRLTTPTLAIITSFGQKVAITIPVGSIVTVIKTDINGNRLVDVMWEERCAMVFTQDLRERGELVSQLSHK